VEVKKGDKNWTVKENELAELPPEVRGPVESLLGRGPMQFRVVGRGDRPQPPRPPQGGPGPGVPGRGDDEVGPPPPGHPEGPGGPPRRAPRARRPGAPDAPGEPGAGPEERGPRERGPGGRDGLERRLEELSREMHRMREQIDGLRRGSRERDDDK